MQWRAAAWLTAYAAAGIVVAILSPDSYQQDGGTHYLFARDAWWNHALLVDVWGRPLFTSLYAIPALAGYLPAKLLTVLICVAAAWQCWRWAEDEGLARPELAIPFLALQPSMFLLMSETMTEPLFALVLVIALRLRRSGRALAALVAASLLPLARPEGFFICLLWGVWSLGDGQLGNAWWRRVRALPLLLTGVVLWWLAALLVTKDPLFILHNWPPNWAPTGAEYGTAPWLDYWRQRNDIINGKFAWLFAVGFIALIARRRLGTATSLVVVLFVLHSILRHYGMFGSAGYPRYFVCVAPAIALITLEGWNVLVDAFHRMLALVTPPIRAPLRVLYYAFAIGLFLIATRNDFYFVDDHDSSRDARAVADADDWLRAHSISENTLVWSQAYMCIIRRCDTRHRLSLSGDKSSNLALLEKTPPGTLIFWDGETGPNWYGLHAPDFQKAGFTELFDKRYELKPRFQRRLWYGNGWTRSQEMSLFYKYQAEPPPSNKVAAQ
jgi:hypothetical protein